MRIDPTDKKEVYETKQQAEARKGQNIKLEKSGFVFDAVKQRNNNSQTQDESGGENRTAVLVRMKNSEYIRAAKINKFLYYFFKLTVGISAALLPYTLDDPFKVKLLSLIIALTTTADMIFKPGHKYKHYGMAADRLVIQRLRRTGELSGFEEVMEIIQQTEHGSYEQLDSDGGNSGDKIPVTGGALFPNQPTNPNRFS